MTLRGSRLLPLLCPLLAAVACRGPVGPRDRDPVVLVTPEAPSALQTRLAAMSPVTGTSTSATRKLDQALDAFHARTKGRRGYIAVDKPLYQPGETIWFRMFELASANLAGGGARDVATFKLVSPRGATVAEKRVMVDDGGAANDFILPGDVAGGEYTLKATTDGGNQAERKVIVSSYEAPRIKKKLEFVRKAYGPGDRVMATIALHRATGEPLANQAITALVTLDGSDLARVPVTTDAQGGATARFELPAQISRGDGLLTILVDDGGVTESIQKRVPITLRDLAVALYPEGGDLVAGLPGRVYFRATNPLGKPADVEGRVLDERGQVVALLRSYHDGMGRFDLVPGTGAYRVEITKPANIARTYELPRAKRAGCAMQALDDFTSQRPDVRVAVWCTKSRDVVVTGVLREQRVATAATHVDAGEPTVVALAMPASVQGAVRVTLFDDELAPQAERLVYRNRGVDLKIKITPDKATYHPRDQVALAIETTNPDGSPVAADLAVSVVDDTVLAFADDKQATLLARLYLEAEMPGQKIEEPNFYFGKEPEAPASLDLVLGTHGWRRFDWKPVLTAPPKPPISDPWAFREDYWSKPRTTKPVRAARAAEPKDEAMREEEKEGEEQKQVARKLVPAKKAPANNRVPVVVAQQAKIPQAAPPPPPVVANAPPPMEDPEPMNRPMAVDRGAADDDFDEDMEIRGEAIEVRRNGDFQNRGRFDIGGENANRKHRIRDARNFDGEIAAADPFCCLVPERVFPQPQYGVRYDGPRTDFRETLLWASRLRTDATGKATTRLFLSDAVTSFKVTAEGVGGNRIGAGEAQVQSKKPVSLAVKLPLEVSAGDHLRLPVTIANETDEPYTARLDAKFGKAFKVGSGALPHELALAPNERRSTFYELDVVGDGVTAEDGKIAIAVDAANLKDEVERTVRVVPLGFPQEVSVAGTLHAGKSVRHEILVSDVLPGSMRGTVAFYPSPIATMAKGTEAMIAEPGGCFEQASSTNYPNIMILGYLEANGAADPALVEKTQGVLTRGYKLLTSYESKSRGYEWFGADPGHEALTAYGLMEFEDMAKVYDSVDKTMVDRTRSWLLARRDGNGGYKKNPHALHTWTADDVTDAYITYALVESGERDLEAEIARQRTIAGDTRDPYVMALATNVLATARPKDAATRAAAKRLAGMQAADGSFPGAKQTVTLSGGDALEIETASLATLALLRSHEHKAEIRKAVEWINSKRSGWGNFGSTQSTVLALKAMTAATNDMRTTDSAGSIALIVNGERVAKVAYEKGHQGAIELDIAKHLRPGKNVVELEHEGGELPYSGVISWGSKIPATSPATKVRVATTLAKSTVKLGEGVRLDAMISNATDKGVPMTLARIGLPGGLTFQTWQLKELRDKKLVDFYETRPREVILYFRELGPREARSIPLELMSTVPGAFTSPASRAYLYYTDEHKHWVAPSTVTVVP